MPSSWLPLKKPKWEDSGGTTAGEGQGAGEAGRHLRGLRVTPKSCAKSNLLFPQQLPHNRAPPSPMSSSSNLNRTRRVKLAKFWRYRCFRLAGTSLLMSARKMEASRYRSRRYGSCKR